MKRYFKSVELREAPVETTEEGVIYGFSVIEEGEAKGHGVHIDADFLQAVAEQGNNLKAGVKMRFGHPAACGTALGTFIGRAKNFRVDGNKVVADAFLSNSAKESPDGDLYTYVLSMAKENPDMFGASISFKAGESYRKDAETGEKVFEADLPYEGELDERVFTSLDSLLAVDYVDEPAATSALFSSSTIAGQVTDFLNEFPEVFSALTSSPEILAILKEHGDKVDEFVSNYSEYGKQYITKKPAEVEDEDKDPADEAVVEADEEVAPVAEVDEDPAPEAEVVEEPQVVVEADEDPADESEVAKKKDDEEEELSSQDDDTVSLEEAEVAPEEEAEVELDEAPEDECECGECECESADEPEVFEAEEDEAAETVALESADEASSDEVAQKPEATIDLSVLNECIAKFGQDIALDVLTNGGSKEDCQKKYYEQLEAENEALKTKLEEGSQPVAFSNEPVSESRKPRFKTGF
jgi:hypothetical protein